MDDGLNAAHNKTLTLEFLSLFGCFSSIRIAAKDLFGAYIFSIGGTSCLPFEQVAQLSAGCQQHHEAQRNGDKTEVFHCFQLVMQ